MVKPQLIEYIEEQLEQGFSFDAIGEALFSQGWKIEEIQEAFAAFEYQEGVEEAVTEEIEVLSPFQQMLKMLGLPTGKLTSTFLVILLGIVTFVALVVLSFGSAFSKSKMPADGINNQKVEDSPLSITDINANDFTKDNMRALDEYQYEINNEEEDLIVDENSGLELDEADGDTDCLNDFDCFIDASINCDTASVRVLSERPFLESAVLSDTDYEITQSSDGGCVFTTVLNKSSLTSDEPLFGKKSVCVYADYEKLTNYLESLKGNENPSYSSDSDKNLADSQAEISGASYCYGPFFDKLEELLSF